MAYIKKKCKQEPFGYQPNNPLTIYYKKYIEKDIPPRKISKKKIKRTYVQSTLENA